MKELNSQNFENEVLKNKRPAVVDFWAPWCGPCRMMMPVMEQVEAELGEKIDFFKVCVDDEGALAEKFGVITIPAILLFENGEVSARSVGGVPKEKILDMLENI